MDTHHKDSSHNLMDAKSLSYDHEHVYIYICIYIYVKIITKTIIRLIQNSMICIYTYIYMYNPGSPLCTKSRISWMMPKHSPKAPNIVWNNFCFLLEHVQSMSKSVSYHMLWYYTLSYGMISFHMI